VGIAAWVACSGQLGYLRFPLIQMNMTRWTLAFAAGLLILGLAAYAATGARSVTALIPAFLGVPVLVCGLVALKTRQTRTAIHIALVFAVLGVLGGAMGLPKLPALLTGGEVARPAAAVMQCVLFFLSAGYLGLGIRSFFRARRRAGDL
jgi:uncharacterized membrane protein